MGVPENRIGIGNRGPEWEGMRPPRSGYADTYPSCGPATPRPVQSCAPHSVGVYARSVDRTCHLSLAHCQSIRHRNTIPNFILDSCEPLSYHFETLCPMEVLEEKDAVTQMMLCMATGILRHRFCICLFSFVACCLSASVGRGFSESRWRRWPWGRRTATSSDSSSNLVKK